MHAVYDIYRLSMGLVTRKPVLGVHDHVRFKQAYTATATNYMGERFQDYSWIQDFEADFP